MVERNQNDEVPRIASTLLKTDVIAACKKLKIDVKNWCVQSAFSFISKIF